jgi:hypothetical protein
MQGYFGQFPENENSARVVLLIESFRFAISMFPAPVPELDIDSNDSRLSYVFAVAKHLDAAIFTPSAMRDAAGRVLWGAVEADPRAVMPAIYREQSVKLRSDDRPTKDEDTTEPEEVPPPSPERVARRALALAAVSGRGLLEKENASEPGVEETRLRLLAWIEAIGIGDELEPDEWKVLQRPLGAISSQDATNACWRLEGLGILAWALNRFDSVSHDQQVIASDLLTSVGILDAEASLELMANPNLRSHEEIAIRREQIFALHWRLRNWRLNGQRLDFREVSRTAWFGPLDISGLQLLESDLAIGKLPIFRASDDAVRFASSAALERHLAINWLAGSSEVYSETDVST